MRDTESAVKKYITVLVVLATLLLVYVSYDMELNDSVIIGFLFFSMLAVITDSLPVPLPRGGSVTVTVPVAYASIILLGPAVTSYVMIIAIVLSKIITGDDDPWYKLMFNCAQFVLASALGGLVYLFLGGELGRVNFDNLLPYLGAALIYISVNCTAFSLAISISQGTSLRSIWLTNLRWVIPNLLMLAPLGLIMAKMYSFTGPLGVILFFIPLMSARFIFKSFMETREIFMNTLEALARAIDAKDRYTRGHSDRVAQYAVELARRIKLPEDQVEIIEHMALLHDVGKIGVSDGLLTRVGCLSEDEVATIKVHPVIGANILKDLNYHGVVPEYVRHHHEKYDGTGYPDRLKGEDIPLGARIIAIADAFDAMTTDRPYRKKMSYEEAVAELKRCSGTHFDPQLVEAFIECIGKQAAAVEGASMAEAAATSVE